MLRLQCVLVLRLLERHEGSLRVDVRRPIAVRGDTSTQIAEDVRSRVGHPTHAPFGEIRILVVQGGRAHLVQDVDAGVGAPVEGGAPLRALDRSPCGVSVEERLITWHDVRQRERVPVPSATFDVGSPKAGKIRRRQRATACYREFRAARRNGVR